MKPLPDEHEATVKPRTPASEPRWQRIRQLSEAVVALTAEHELERVLQLIADSAREVMDARYAALGVLDESGEALARFIVSGVTPEQYDRIGHLPTGKGILGVLIRDPQPLRLPDLSKYPDSAGFPPHHPEMHSFLGVPILGREGPLGNLYITEKRAAAEFTPEDEALAVMFAAHAAVALTNARYHEEREQLLREVRAMQVSRDRFFAMINHELRNALTAVHGWAELWIRKTRPDTPRPAQEVYESAERAVTLLEDMLDLSRLDAERLEPRIREADAREAARESVGTVEPAAERRGVRIEVDTPADAVPCRTDPQRVRQILINLLTNAIRHSPAGGAVRVSLTVEHGTLRYEVVDDGEGIPPDLQASIFEAFERAGKETERGTGLGLALSRKLARLLGGDLTVDSRAGEGARFTLRLPREISTEIVKTPS